LNSSLICELHSIIRPFGLDVHGLVEVGVHEGAERREQFIISFILFFCEDLILLVFPSLRLIECLVHSFEICVQEAIDIILWVEAFVTWEELRLSLGSYVVLLV